jgi:regulator of sigma E protease
VSWVVVFLGLISLIVLHEFGHFAVAKAVGMRVERFALFFPPLLVKKKIGETEYGIGAIPLGGYVKISGMSPAEDLPDEVRTRAYYSQPIWKRIVVIAAGPAMNLLIAFVVLLVFYSAIGVHDFSNRIGTIERSYPAAHALKLGDRLISVDGKRGSLATLSAQIAKHKCAQQPPVKGCKATTPVHIVVKRDGRLVRLTLTPIYDPATAKTRLGFGFDDNGPRRTLAFSSALSASADQFWYITKETVSLPARILNPKERKQISGIVGVSDVAHQTVANDPGLAVLLLAVVSLSLAIVNLFPFLPLDGGHIFWAVAEKVRGRAIPFSVMERAGFVGFALVIGLFMIGFTNDINRLTGPGFGLTR